MKIAFTACCNFQNGEQTLSTFSTRCPSSMIFLGVHNRYTFFRFLQHFYILYLNVLCRHFFFTDLFFPLFVVFVKHSAYLSELPRQINTETSCLVEMRHLMQYKLFLMRTLESGWSRRHDPPLRD